MSAIDPSHALIFDDDEENPHKPGLSVWTEDAGTVVMTIAAKHGQQLRYVEMSPKDATRLGRELLERARSIVRHHMEHSKS